MMNRELFIRSVTAAALLAVDGSSCTSDRTPVSGHQEVASTQQASVAAAKLDPLDSVPAHMGDLKLVGAWRVAAAGVVQILGQYEWQAGNPGSADLTCTLPKNDEAECDSSIPAKIKFGSVKACAAMSDDQESKTGPLISWPSCVLQMAYGQGGRRRFEQLKKAAAEAIPWTQRVLAWTDATADLSSIQRNREAGLLLASQRGNDRVPGLSHQLDPR